MICGQTHVNATFLVGQPGRQFFDLWRRSRLLSSIGFPTARTFTTISRPPRPHIIELRFTHGRLRLDITNSGNPCATAYNRDGVAGSQICGPRAILTVPPVPPPVPLRPWCPPSCPRVAPAECRTDFDLQFPDCSLNAGGLCESLWEMCESQEPLRGVQHPTNNERFQLVCVPNIYTIVFSATYPLHSVQGGYVRVKFRCRASLSLKLLCFSTCPSIPKLYRTIVRSQSE